MTSPSRSGQWRVAAESRLAFGHSIDGPAGVVHVVAEYAPFARTGGLAEAVAALAKWQAQDGVPVAVILPLYRSVRRVAPSLVPVGRPMSIEFGPRTEQFRLWRLASTAGTPRVFFIEHDGFFDRAGLYGAGGADFVDMARQYSNDGSAGQGGDLGWIYPGDTVPEFERAMAALKPMQISDPVRTPFGYHLIQVLERRTDEASPDRVRAAARQAVRERKISEAFQEWTRQIRDRAYVVYRLDER
jgi:hypothetical protein